MLVDGGPNTCGDLETRISKNWGIYSLVFLFSFFFAGISLAAGSSILELARKEEIPYLLEQFYLHPIYFSLHPVREIRCKHGMCMIWGV